MEEAKKTTEQAAVPASTAGTTPDYAAGLSTTTAFTPGTPQTTPTIQRETRNKILLTSTILSFNVNINFSIDSSASDARDTSYTRGIAASADPRAGHTFHAYRRYQDTDIAGECGCYAG